MALRKRIRILYVNDSRREAPAGGTTIVFMCGTDREEKVQIEIPLYCAGYSVVRKLREAMKKEILEAQSALDILKREANE